MAFFDNWFHWFHKLATHRAIIGTFRKSIWTTPGHAILYIKKWQHLYEFCFYHIAYIYVHVTQYLNIHEKNADDAFSFIRKVKDESENIRKYITKVQALFCPDQSIRETGNTEERSDVINSLPPELTIGNDSVKLVDLPSVLGIRMLHALRVLKKTTVALLNDLWMALSSRAVSEQRFACVPASFLSYTNTILTTDAKTPSIYIIVWTRFYQ